MSESISSLFGAQRLESISGKTFGHGIRYVVECRNIVDDKSLLGHTFSYEMIWDLYMF